MPPIGARPSLDCIYNNDMNTFKSILPLFDDKYKAILMFQSIIHRRTAFVALLLTQGVDPVPFQTYVQERIVGASDDGERAAFEVIEAMLKS